MVDRPVTSVDVRRFFPPLRRRPRLVVVVARWWFELMAAGVLAAASWSAVGLLGGPGAVALGLAAGATLAAAAKIEPARDLLFCIVQRMIVPHRLRLGFIRGGVLTRGGRLPAIVRSRCRVDQARFWVRLPSGLLVEDLAAARTVLAVSCGATDVVVVRDGPRQDRAVVIVVRPRWGWPGR